MFFPLRVRSTSRKTTEAFPSYPPRSFFLPGSRPSFDDLSSPLLDVCGFFSPLPFLTPHSLSGRAPGPLNVWPWTMDPLYFPPCFFEQFFSLFLSSLHTPSVISPLCVGVLFFLLAVPTPLLGENFSFSLLFLPSGPLSSRSGLPSDLSKDRQHPNFGAPTMTFFLFIRDLLRFFFFFFFFFGGCFFFFWGGVSFWGVDLVLCTSPFLYPPSLPSPLYEL